MNNRKIYSAHRYQSGCGTHKYHVLFTGDWDMTDLITAIDNGVYDNPTEEELQISHYGGRIEDYKVNADGTQEANVMVYYD